MAEEFILSGMEPWSFRVGYIDVSDARMFRLEREDARRAFGRVFCHTCCDTDLYQLPKTVQGDCADLKSRKISGGGRRRSSGSLTDPDKLTKKLKSN